MKEEPRALIPAEAYDALVHAGVDVAAAVTDDGQVDVVVDVPGAVPALALQVKRYTRPLTPGGVATAADRWAAAAGHRIATPGSPRHGLLLVTPSATAETVRRAADLGVSLIALDRRTRDGVHGHLALGPGDVVPLGRAATGPAQDRRKAGDPARGELRIVKALLLFGGRTQAEVARWAGVSQPRVSQVMRRLAEQDLVSSSAAAGGASSPRRTWAVVDRNWNRLLRHWLSGYPGPGGVTTYWYGLEAPVAQARAALGVLTDRRVLVSGDVAADLVAPWARPAHATLYTDAGADLSAAGLTPCPAADSTLALTVPEEAELWAFADHWWRVTGQNPAPGGLPLADPLQIMHDTGNSPSPDNDQAMETLSAHIHRRRTPTPANPEASR
jgi:hypothetical protein